MLQPSERIRGPCLRLALLPQQLDVCNAKSVELVRADIARQVVSSKGPPREAAAVLCIDRLGALADNVILESYAAPRPLSRRPISGGNVQAREGFFLLAACKRAFLTRAVAILLGASAGLSLERT